MATFPALGGSRDHLTSRTLRLGRRDRSLIAGPAHLGVGSLVGTEQPREIEFVFEPQAEGGYQVYAPELPGLHTQGDSLDQATDNAREALALYIEGLQDDGRSLPTGIVRRTLPVPA